MLEALGRIQGARAIAKLKTFIANQASAADRAKLAEAIADRADALDILRRLAKDPDATVRANAVWALGKVGTGADRNRLEQQVQDRDVVVAANAATALGRLLARHASSNPTQALCRVLDSRRSAVRAGALIGLRLAGRRCNKGKSARAMLGNDSSERVRRAAAALLKLSPVAVADRRALADCALSDKSGSVSGELFRSRQQSCERNSARPCDGDSIWAFSSYRKRSLRTPLCRRLRPLWAGRSPRPSHGTFGSPRRR